MKVLVTTVIRYAPVGQSVTGRILEIDWSSGEVVQCLAVPDPLYPRSNLNPRGGLRGARGIRRWQGEYYVANYDSIHIYDENWKLRDRITHPLAVDIHEIDIDEKGIWLSCSSLDLALKLNRRGEVRDAWHLSEAAPLARRLGVDCRPLDRSKDYRRHLPNGCDTSHLNSVQIDPSGAIIVNLGRVISARLRHRLLRRLFERPTGRILTRAERRVFSLLEGSRGYIVHAHPGGALAPQILASYRTLRPSHNGQMLDGHRAVLCHEDSELVITDLRQRRAKRLQISGNWLRGLAVVDDSTVLVGIGPCGVVEVNWRTGRIVKILPLSDNPNESVHGLAVVKRRVRSGHR